MKRILLIFILVCNQIYPILSQNKLNKDIKSWDLILNEHEIGAFIVEEESYDYDYESGEVIRLGSGEEEVKTTSKHVFKEKYNSNSELFTEISVEVYKSINYAKNAFSQDSLNHFSEYMENIDVKPTLKYYKEKTKI